MMWAAGVPCPGDPLMTCGSGGGSWWPLVLGVVGLALAWRRGWFR